MAEVKVLFTAGHNIVGEIVEVLTHSKFAHASIFILGGIVEAIQPAVVLSLADKYDGVDQASILVELADMAAAELEAQNLIGVPYGLFTDCVSGGLNDLAGYQSDGNGTKTVNCSETVTRILRAGGVDVLSGIPPDCITPENLYQALLEIKRQEVA